MFNDGSGEFTTEFNLDNDSGPGVGPREIDFDNDGDLDQILNHYSWNESLGNGNYEVRIIDDVLENATTSIEDVDEDGDYDIVVVILDSDSPDNLSLIHI